MTHATGPYHEELLLAERAISGEAAACAEVYRRLSSIPRMLRSQNFKLGRPMNEHDLQDLEQDVLITVWRRLGMYNGSGSLDAYVYRISFNLFMNRLRRKKRAAARDIDKSETLHPADPDSALEALERHEEVYRALDTLEDGEREIVVLRTMEELSFEDVAERLGIPVGTAKDRYYRARLKLRAFFKGRKEGVATHEAAT